MSFGSENHQIFEIRIGKYYLAYGRRLKELNTVEDLKDSIKKSFEIAKKQEVKPIENKEPVSVDKKEEKQKTLADVFHDIQDKYLIAELWETQAILVWILSTQVNNPWKILLIIWGVINILSCGLLKKAHRDGLKK